MNTQYTRYIKFIKDAIVDAGFTKTSGEPNVDAFYKHYGLSALKGTGLSLGKTNFRNQVSGPENSPFGHTLEAMAAILSSASGKKITVADLDSLIDRKPLNKFGALDPASLPSDEAGSIVRAGQLLKEIRCLPIEARASIAPLLLRELSNDWAYLDSPDRMKVSRLLQNELARRGIGCEAFAKIMKDVIPMEALQDIRECRIPSKPLTREQLLILQAHMRSIDDDAVTFEELKCLTAAGS